MRRAALAATTCLTLAAAAAHATPCTDLAQAKLQLGHASVVSLTAVDVPASPPLPAYCAVNAVVSGNGNPQQSQIAVAVWLPETGWNGRFLGTGNGGFAGTISLGVLELGVAEGFATANTDMGTGILFGCNTLNCGNDTGQGKPGGLFRDPPAIEDFGYRSTHLMTIVGKQLTTAYYTYPAAHNYFAGCSTGGQQALMESQRYPADYDGILAGAPAHNRTHLHMAGPAAYEITHIPGAYLTNAALALVHATVLKQCTGTDGGLATDAFLTLPNSCATDAAVLQCKGAQGEVPCTDPNATSCTCLEPPQVQAMNLDWRGAEDDQGRTLYPGVERGTEDGSAGLSFQESLTEPAFDSLMFWARGKKWVWQDMFFQTVSAAPELSAEIALIDNSRIARFTFAGVLNANSTDLSAFSARGGKILMYQGYADPLIPSATAIDYYNAVADADAANVGNYLRLFMAPGTWHCTGGPGANDFGGLGQIPPQPLNPADDALGALIAWTEYAVPPKQIVATKYVNDDPTQGIAFQRPLCRYPAHSAYVSGDPTKASSFKCAASPPVTNQPFSPIYGP